MESFRITDSPATVAPEKESGRQVASGVQSKTHLRDGKAVAQALTDSKTVAEEKSQDQPGVKELQKVVDKMNSAMQIVDTRIQMTVDEDTGKTVIKIVNSASGETIREIPPKSLLKIAATVDEYLKSGQEKESVPEGVVFDRKA